ncbi:MAG: type I methionyl aminopeptidase [Candidatus Wallbacteria bacterium]|nr:type I methionyl aminopeptidase [Candidatus Wallbacteria bacterium]MBI4867788.1 type I methionyl aminopeptidase [Candidatus Wallbacteria bacterium]
MCGAVPGELERGVTLKTKAELDIMRVAGRHVAEILLELTEAVKPGVTTMALNRIAEEAIRKRKVKSPFLGYQPHRGMPPYPASLCTSVNDEVVHGIPSDKTVLKEGDVIGLDFAIVHEGFVADAAVSLPVGRVSKSIHRMLNVGRQSLLEGIFQTKPSRRINDIGHAVQSYAEKHNYSIVRDYMGHGVGRKMHEPPSVPNYGEPGTGMKLVPGLVLAIEPMLNLGVKETFVAEDGWTVKTADGKLSVHFEHTIAVTEDGPEILTKL